MVATEETDLEQEFAANIVSDRNVIESSDPRITSSGIELHGKYQDNLSKVISFSCNE